MAKNEKALEVLEHLSSQGFLSDQLLDSLVTQIREAGSQRLVETLLDQYGLRPDVVAASVGEVLGLPVMSNHVAPLKVGPDFILADDRYVYVVDPLDRRRLSSVLAQIDRSLVQGCGVLPYSALDQMAKQESTVELSATAAAQFEDVIRKAVRLGGSDIHIIPMKGKAIAAVRVNRQLRPISGLEWELDKSYRDLGDVILIRANENPGEINKPVDAQFEWSLGHRTINVRVSMVPVRVGMDVYPRFTLRILGLDVDLVDLAGLGLPAYGSNQVLEDLKECASQSDGLVVVSGPTGSGKTTTLMALMRWLSNEFPYRSYHSLEDPVEIEAPNISQVEINEDAGLTYARGLKAFLRQDPDVMLVGEIRDEETLGLVLRASITGHMVLSTLHTKSAFGVIPRMLDMKNDPALVADALSGVMAQRMTRKLCPDCKVQTTIQELEEGRQEALMRLPSLVRRSLRNAHKKYGDLPSFPGKADPIYLAGPGCSTCKDGYRGSTVIAEFCRLDEGLKEMIVQGASVREMEAAAAKRHFFPMWEHGIHLVKAGVTSLDEVERSLVSRPAFEGPAPEHSVSVDDQKRREATAQQRV